MKHVIEFVLGSPPIMISFVVGAVLAILMLMVKVKNAFLAPCLSGSLFLFGILLMGIVGEFGLLLFLLGIGSFFGYLISYPLTYAIKNFRSNKKPEKSKKTPEEINQNDYELQRLIETLEKKSDDDNQ